MSHSLPSSLILKNLMTYISLNTQLFEPFICVRSHQGALEKGFMTEFLSFLVVRSTAAEKMIGNLGASDRRIG